MAAGFAECLTGRPDHGPRHAHPVGSKDSPGVSDLRCHHVANPNDVIDEQADGEHEAGIARFPCGAFARSSIFISQTFRERPDPASQCSPE